MCALVDHRPVRERLVVLKFGSSVLSSPAGYVAAAAEIGKEVRSGARVLAVVSAMGKTTDDLVSLAGFVSDSPPGGLLAQLLSTGEDASAALLGMALDRAGCSVRVIPASRCGVRTEGPAEDATPVMLEPRRLRAAIAVHEVVVVAGFVGRDRSGALALLGRGGSDLTALFLGHRLGAREVRLVKDVDGVYPVDPRQAARDAQPLRAASFDFVRQVGGGVVQEKALRYAELHGLGFRVAAPGGRGTWVGPRPNHRVAPRGGP